MSIIRIFGSVETHMNRRSHPNYENSFGMFPASGPLRGTAGQITVFFLRQLNRRGGVPSGAAVFIVFGVWRSQPPSL